MDDGHDSCRHQIMDLERQLNSQAQVKMVIIHASDGLGHEWDRVGTIKSIVRMPDGLVITVV